MEERIDDERLAPYATVMPPQCVEQLRSSDAEQKRNVTALADAGCESAVVSLVQSLSVNRHDSGYTRGANT